MDQPTKENGKKTHRMAGASSDGQMNRCTKDFSEMAAATATVALSSFQMDSGMKAHGLIMLWKEEVLPPIPMGKSMRVCGLRGVEKGEELFVLPMAQYMKDGSRTTTWKAKAQ